MSVTQPIRILIADDHPIVREGLAALLERRPDMNVVATAANCAQARVMSDREQKLRAIS